MIHNGTIYTNRYEEQDLDEDHAAEGRERKVPFRGPAGEIFVGLAAGVRSGMSYIDAHTIPEMRKKGNFEHVTGAGANEQYGEIE